MTNRQISRYIKEFRGARQGWMDILSSNGDSVRASQHILAINTKIELLRSMYNFAIDTDDILI